MCQECFATRAPNGPAQVTPAMRQAVALVQELYELHGTGGPLHVFSDDWNIDDGNLTGCLQWAADPRWDKDYTDRLEELVTLRNVAMRLVALFLPMSERERATVLAMVRGWLPPGTFVDAPPTPPTSFRHTAQIEAFIVGPKRDGDAPYRA